MNDMKPDDSQKKLTGLPVLMLSGHVDDRAKGLLELYPGVRILHKPCDMTDLRRVLQDWL